MQSADYFVIPAQAGTQVVPRQSVRSQHGPHDTPILGTPLKQLAIGLGTAWVPACAGMTK